MEICFFFWNSISLSIHYVKSQHFLKQQVPLKLIAFSGTSWKQMEYLHNWQTSHRKSKKSGLNLQEKPQGGRDGRARLILRILAFCVFDVGFQSVISLIFRFGRF